MELFIETIKQILKEIKSEKYYHFPSAIAKKIPVIKDDKTVSNLELLSKCCYFHFRIKEQFNPFGNDINKLTDDEIQKIKDMIEVIPSNELTARLSDIIWVRTREFNYAKKAINSYQEVALQLSDFDNWIQLGNAFERSLRLSSLFKKKHIEIFDKVIKNIENLVIKINGQDKKFLSIHLIELLKDFDFEKSKKYISLIKQIATNSEKNKDFHKAEKAWYLYIDLCKDNESSKREGNIFLVNCYVQQSKNVDENILAAHWLEKAVNVCKNISNYKAERDNIYKELVIAQKEALKELQPIEIDLPDQTAFVEQSISLIENKSLEEALFILALKSFRIPNYATIREQTIESVKEHPFISIMGGIILDREGKTIKRKPSLFSDNVDEQESGIWNEMLRSIILQHSLSVRVAINPIREEICKRYYFDENLFLTYCQNNPFIHHGQEYLYSKGLYAGLTEDYITSISVLIPVLENSLRFLLEQRGEIISTLNTNNVQEVIRINAILNHPKLKEILDENIINDLKCLLTEPAAYNFRNKFSHGLLLAHDFYQEGAYYLWAIVLRLILFPFYKKEKA